MPRSQLRTEIALASFLAGVWLLAAAPPVNAGCGCDHPPPAWTQVMPPFAAAGKAIRIYADGFSFRPGQQYRVDFKPISGTGASALATAATAEYLDLVRPIGVTPGPSAIRVRSAGNNSVDHTYPSSAFTALPGFVRVPATEGAYAKLRIEAAVTMDGTLLLPVNVRQVLDPMQFAFRLSDLPYEFDADDVVIYNADGVDLTLFTLAVDGQTAMEWGSYYGWTVEDDTEIFGTVYDTKVKRSSQPDKSSDVLTYWRHEFATYAQAHQPGGTHAVDANGFHPKESPTYGTLHVNHGHLVLAIAGLKRSANDPTNPSRMAPLQPGKVSVDVQVLTLRSEQPIEPDVMAGQLEGTTSFGSFEPAECHYDEFASYDSGVSCSGY